MKAQDDQTIGIPIGPDTSLILSEVVATAVDNALSSRITHLQGYRHYDDYEFLCRSPDESEELISHLQDTLYEFELRLNPGKTKVYEVPVRLDEQWISTLKHMDISPNAREEAAELIRYFDSVGDYVREHPEKHVMKFALGRLRKRPTNRENWNLFQSLLGQAIISDSSAISQFVAVLTHHKDNGYEISRDLFEPLLNEIIIKYSPLHFHEEVSWALWALLAFRFEVEAKAAATMAGVSNSIVALLALDAGQQGRVKGGLDMTEWQTKMSQAELFDDQWLLAYEANVKGWLPSQGGADHVRDNPFFAELKKRHIHFYTQVTNTDALAASLAMRAEYFTYGQQFATGTPEPES